MEFFSAGLGSLAGVLRFQLLLLRRITKHERCVAGTGDYASPGLSR